MAGKALVAGPRGIVGRGYLEYMAAHHPDWELVGFSRSLPDDHFRKQIGDRAKFLSLDLLDRAACREQLAPHRDASHLVYVAVNEQPDLVAGWQAEQHARTNLAMLQNVLDAIEGPALRHVTLMQGTKAYGVHLGPFKIPAKESDPRYMPPNFYYEQMDWIAERQRGRDWTYTILRPQIVVGFALDSAMNIASTIAAYAAISKELGLPLRFPGTNWRHLWEMVDSHLLAEAIYWAGTTPACAGEIFNITNGDVCNWEGLWPRIAEIFGMEMWPAQPLRLSAMMADKQPVWERICARHDLRHRDLAAVTSWPYGDMLFNGDYSWVVSTVKSRQCGFTAVRDSERMMMDLLRRLQDENIIPAY